MFGVNLSLDERARQAAYELEVRHILEEAHQVWAGFAAARRFAFEANMFGDMPGFRGALEGTSIGVEIAGVGSLKLGFRTRALVQALAPSKLDVHVAPHGAGLWDDLVELLRPSAFFEEPALDHRLVVTTSSHDLALRVLDERVRGTLRMLAPEGMRFTYASGAISLEWAGVERNVAVLDDVLDLLGHLARQGTEIDPYR